MNVSKNKKCTNCYFFFFTIVWLNLKKMSIKYKKRKKFNSTTCKVIINKINVYTVDS